MFVQNRRGNTSRGQPRKNRSFGRTEVKKILQDPGLTVPGIMSVVCRLLLLFIRDLLQQASFPHVPHFCSRLYRVSTLPLTPPRITVQYMKFRISADSHDHHGSTDCGPGARPPGPRKILHALYPTERPLG